MNNLATVSETETGVVRVFALVRPSDLARGTALTSDQLEAWIGAGPLDESQVQQLWTDDLSEMSLQDFLTAGYAVNADDLTQSRNALEGVMDLHPTVLVIVRSPAFLTRPTRIGDEGPLHLVATLREPDASVTFQDLPNPDPEAVLQDPPQRKQPSDAAMSGRVATIALLVMAVLVILMIWIAG